MFFFFFRDVVRTFCIFSLLFFLDTLFLLCDSKRCILIDIYIYILRLLLHSFTYLFMCCFFSLFIHMFLIYCMQSFIFLFHTKMSWWVLFKVFQIHRLLKSFQPWILFLQSFSRVCVRIRFCCIQLVSMSWVIYDFSHMFICLLWFCHGLPKGEIVRTYVNHVRNICHLELANPLTKRTLLVIGKI